MVLLIAEIIAPGFFLFFVGAAAMTTGILGAAARFGLVPQLAIFAILAFLGVQFGGRRFYAARYDYSADRTSTIRQRACSAGSSSWCSQSIRTAAA